MQKALLILISGLLLLPMIFSGCEDDDPVPLPPKKIGMVVDNAGFDDSGFNENCRNGLEQAREDMYLNVEYLVGDNSDLYTAIDSLVRRDVDLLFTVGYLMKDPTLLAAQTSATTKYAVIDVEYEAPEDNLLGVVFNSDEASFLAGYLAAGWSVIKDSNDPKVGFVAGMDIPPVNQFIVGYTNGVTYYMDQYGIDVPVMGNYAGDFADSTRGAEIADSLFNLGVDVMFGVGGLAGNASLIQASVNDKYCIGTDMDMYYVYEEIQNNILTSCLKRVDNAVYDIVSAYVEEFEFDGGGLYVGNLENDGVGFASYHNFYSEIPDSLKQSLIDIKDMIVSGDVLTGWPVDSE